MKADIKVGFCIAYDWELLRHALPLVYNDATLILLAIDRQRKTWSGQSFDFDQPAFQQWVNSVDPKGKVRIYEDDFFVAGQPPMQNEVRQRNLMAQAMGEGGWHIQLDCDEYVVGFNSFVSYLRSLPAARFQRTNICCDLITLFKKTESGFVYVEPTSGTTVERIAIATLTPHYEHGRRNGDFNHYTTFKIIHQTWARSRAEVIQKIENWGHAIDFDTRAYLQFWDSINDKNYQDFRDIHPIQPALWPQLNMLSGATIEEVIEAAARRQFPGFTKWQLFTQNSRNLSRVRKLFSLIAGVFKGKG